MSSAPSLPFPLPFFRRAKKQRLGLNAEHVRPIEIASPDQLSTALLLEYAAPSFPAEVVSGTSWIVRLEPPAAGGKWVFELLLLVERWLESTSLPSADVHYGGRRYVIRASTGVQGSQA